MNKEEYDDQRKYFAAIFWVTLIVYAISASLVLAAITGLIQMQPDFERALFGVVLVQFLGVLLLIFKVGVRNTLRKPPEIEGDWVYECIRNGGQFAHGGVATISISKGAYGYEFNIEGRRLWVGEIKDGQMARTNLPAPFAWSNTWGVITGPKSLRYEYAIEVNGKLVQGYGTAAIRASRPGGRPTLMEGNFYQLPPNDPFFGFQRYTRAAIDAAEQPKTEVPREDLMLAEHG